jgi:acyl-CoA synthetase (AMP-forming)/AMP-acid ligase II
MNMFQDELHLLSTGVPVTSLSPYSNPFQEYKVAFEDREQPFLEYYSFAGKLVKKRALTRGEFWNLACSPALNQDDEKIVIFTSGTTGESKGVSLSYGNYLANKLTFEQYFGVSEMTQLDILLVNPLHHTNSTAFLDWAMRRGGTKIHLLQRYSTPYWKVLVDVARQKRDLLIAPMVSRHIDFLEELHIRSELPAEVEEIKSALSATDMMIGSAPVGPTTIKRVLTFSDHLPIVRFGSTETCLQVMATPRTLSQNELAKAFEAIPE